MKLLVLHGPNLNLLGHRDVANYGKATLQEIDARLLDSAKRHGATLESRQSNCEGELISWIQQAAFGEDKQRMAGVLLNPGAYAHTSLALADAIEDVVRQGVPVIEVHLSNVHGREPTRERLLTAKAASGVVSGLGPLSYDLGFEAVMALAREQLR